VRVLRRSRIAVATLDSKQVAVYDFDRGHGHPYDGRAATAVQSWTTSPSARERQAGVFQHLRRHELWPAANGRGDARQRTILTNDLSAIEPGPDAGSTLGSSTNNGIHCINLPDKLQHAETERVRPQQERRAAAGGRQPDDLGHAANMNQQCAQGGPQPAQFTYTVSNCVNVTFHASLPGPVHVELRRLDRRDGQNPSHVISSQGTYTASLTVPGASPRSCSRTLVLQLLPVSIGRPDEPVREPSNYSRLGPAPTSTHGPWSEATGERERQQRGT